MLTRGYSTGELVTGVYQNSRSNLGGAMCKFNFTYFNFILMPILFKMPNASILPDIREKILVADLSEMFSDISKLGISS